MGIGLSGVVGAIGSGANSGGYTGRVVNTGLGSNIGNKSLSGDDKWKRAIANTLDIGGNVSGVFLGGGGDSEEAPTLRDIFREYPGIVNDLFALTQEMAPQQAELQAQLQEQYMPRLLQSQQDALSSVSPYGAGLTELLAQQATEGMSGDLTDSERRAFMDVQKSLVGNQSTSGIGTDYIGSNLLNYVQGRKSNAQQLGLQTRSLLPQLTLQTPSYMDYSQQYTPGQFIGASQAEQQMLYNMQSADSGSMGGIMSLLSNMLGNKSNTGAAGTTGTALNNSSSVNAYQPSYATAPAVKVGPGGQYQTTPLSYNTVSGLGGNWYD